MKRCALIATALIFVLVAGCDGGGDIDVIGTDERTTETENDPSTTTSEPEETTTTAGPVDLTFDSGFTSGEDFGVRYTSAGALVTNPNEGQAAYDVQVLFNLIGADGSVLDSQSADVPYVPAGATVAVAPLQIGFDIPSGPTGLEATATGDFREDEGWSGVEFSIGSGIDLEVTDAQIVPGSFGVVSLTAQVTNPSEEIAEFGTWSCVFRADGAVLGGAMSGIVDRIPPGATVALDFPLTPEVSADEVICNAYA